MALKAINTFIIKAYYSLYTIHFTIDLKIN